VAVETVKKGEKIEMEFKNKMKEND